MNLLYLRAGAPRTRKFIKKKLRGSGEPSICDIEAGGCRLAPLPVKRRDYIVTFLNNIFPEMPDFVYRSGIRAGAAQ